MCFSSYWTIFSHTFTLRHQSANHFSNSDKKTYKMLTFFFFVFFFPGKLSLSGFTTSTTESSTTDTSESEPDFKVIQKKIAVMKPDDEKFSEFFSSSSTQVVSKLVKHSAKETSSFSSTKTAGFEMSVSDFDAITEITKPR